VLEFVESISSVSNFCLINLYQCQIENIHQISTVWRVWSECKSECGVINCNPTSEGGATDRNRTELTLEY
jgi:hypothetical protein